MNELKDAIALLERQRAEAQAQVDKLDKALQLLRDLDRGVSETRVVENHTNGIRPPEMVRPGQGVRSRVIRLAQEADRDWSATEILEEFERRGDPLRAKDPQNALRTAFAEAMKGKHLVRVGVGRYKARKWVSREELVDLVASVNRGT